MESDRSFDDVYEKKGAGDACENSTLVTFQLSTTTATMLSTKREKASYNRSFLFMTLFFGKLS